MFREGKNDDEYFTRDDFAKFRERYTERINNFRNNIAASNDIVLVYTLPFRSFSFSEEVADLDFICSLLTERYPTKRFSHITITLPNAP